MQQKVDTQEKLDVSEEQWQARIDLAAAHRLAVKTFICEWDRETLREACLREIKRGGQVYFLHNDVASIERMAGELDRWDRGDGFPATRTAWLARTGGLGETITVRSHQPPVSGRFEAPQTVMDAEIWCPLTICRSSPSAIRCRAWS